jgi:hypothetical protein
MVSAFLDALDVGAEEDDGADNPPDKVEYEKCTTIKPHAALSPI